ncbi:MAG: hypothetical protein HYZ53_17195 [Planctomycetes bacterium]|nr:hypothetical protein [Planctomycetota bacterium]
MRRNGSSPPLLAGVLAATIAVVLGCGTGLATADEAWLPVVTVTGNRREHVAEEVPRVVTDRLRLVVTRASAAPGADAARIAEVELFGPVGKIAIARVRADTAAPGHDAAQACDGDRRYADGGGAGGGGADREARGWASLPLAQDRPRTLEIELARAVEVGELVLCLASVEAQRIQAFQLLAPRSTVEARTTPAPAPAPADLEALGDFRPTFYWTTHEEDFTGPADTPLLLADGTTLGRFPAAFVKALGLEGSGRLRDGRVLNVSGKAGSFNFVDAAYGMGVRSYHLLPFRSVAVDKKELPIGSKLYLPAARGVRLPDGTVHDGIFYAQDVGGGIKGKRFDIFIGRKAHQAAWERAGVGNMKPLALFKCTG